MRNRRYSVSKPIGAVASRKRDLQKSYLTTGSSTAGSTSDEPRHGRYSTPTSFTSTSHSYSGGHCFTSQNAIVVDLTSDPYLDCDTDGEVKEASMEFAQDNFLKNCGDKDLVEDLVEDSDEESYQVTYAELIDGLDENMIAFANSLRERANDSTDDESLGELVEKWAERPEEDPNIYINRKTSCATQLYAEWYKGDGIHTPICEREHHFRAQYGKRGGCYLFFTKRKRIITLIEHIVEDESIPIKSEEEAAKVIDTMISLNGITMASLCQYEIVYDDALRHNLLETWNYL